MGEKDVPGRRAQHEKSKSSAYVRRGCALVLLGAACWVAGILWPLYQGSTGTPTITIHRGIVALAVGAPIIGILVAALREKVVDWIPTQPDEKVTGKHLAYVMSVTIVCLVVYFGVVGQLESIGYVQVR